MYIFGLSFVLVERQVAVVPFDGVFIYPKRVKSAINDHTQEVIADIDPVIDQFVVYLKSFLRLISWVFKVQIVIYLVLKSLFHSV